MYMKPFQNSRNPQTLKHLKGHFGPVLVGWTRFCWQVIRINPGNTKYCWHCSKCSMRERSIHPIRKIRFPLWCRTDISRSSWATSADLERGSFESRITGQLWTQLSSCIRSGIAWQKETFQRKKFSQKFGYNANCWNSNKRNNEWKFG